MAARGRPGVGAEAEALLSQVALRVAADHIDQQQVLPALLVIRIPKSAAQEKTIQVVNAGHVAGANAEDGALGRFVGRLDLQLPVAAARRQQALDMRKDEPLGRVIGVGKMNLHLLAVFVADRVEPGIAAMPAERRQHLVAALPQQVHDAQYIGAGYDAGFHAASLPAGTGIGWPPSISFSTRTGTSLPPSPAAPRICCSTWRTK